MFQNRHLRIHPSIDAVLRATIFRLIEAAGRNSPRDAFLEAQIGEVVYAC